MRGMIAVATAGLLLAISSPAAAQERPALRETFFTPPLVPTAGFVDSTFAASFVSIGSAPVEVTIQYCNLGGVCTTPALCVSTALTQGQGCSSFVQDVDPLYAKFLLKKTGPGTVDGLGSLLLIDPDGAKSAAVQTIRSGRLEKLVTEGP